MLMVALVESSGIGLDVHPDKWMKKMKHTTTCSTTKKDERVTFAKEIQHLSSFSTYRDLYKHL